MKPAKSALASAVAIAVIGIAASILWPASQPHVFSFPASDGKSHMAYRYTARAMAANMVAKRPMACNRVSVAAPLGF